MATIEELAWAAGLFDGEGCITISRQRPGTGRRESLNYRLFLKVTMGHRPTIERLVAIFSVGSIHPWCDSSDREHNPAYSWWVASRQAVAVIEQLRPYLVTKAIEADLALEWGRLPLAPRGGRGGGTRVPAELLAARHRLFEAMRDAKPSARFRAGRANDAGA